MCRRLRYNVDGSFYHSTGSSNETSNQGNTTDCGVVAIAATIEVFGQRRAFNFDVEMLRKHLATCLQRHHTVPNL